MKKLKIGIMQREQFQEHILAIASGSIVPKRGDPKIWFSSIKSLGAVLSENNMRLLKILDEQHPQSLEELARLSGRHKSNLSRTLKTMEKYGIVELRKNRQFVQPIAKATGFDIEYVV